jgi:hypothetical protein
LLPAGRSPLPLLPELPLVTVGLGAEPLLPELPPAAVGLGAEPLLPELPPAAVGLGVEPLLPELPLLPATRDGHVSGIGGRHTGGAPATARPGTTTTRPPARKAAITSVRPAGIFPGSIRARTRVQLIAPGFTAVTLGDTEDAAAQPSSIRTTLALTPSAVNLAFAGAIPSLRRISTVHVPS